MNLDWREEERRRDDIKQKRNKAILKVLHLRCRMFYSAAVFETKDSDKHLWPYVSPIFSFLLRKQLINDL